ncbi:MAG: DUF4154 domain-containing protein [Planctomycetes bacterium]|nr:DUF4154 domain-containing protein [Planctomycetota bacterium]
MIVKLVIAERWSHFVAHSPAMSPSIESASPAATAWNSTNPGWTGNSVTKGCIASMRRAPVSSARVAPPSTKARVNSPALSGTISTSAMLPCILPMISEVAGFASAGGTVNFFREEGRVRFEINIDAAKRQRLSFSAKLLKLARLVHDGDGTDTYHFEFTDDADPILSGKIGLTVWGENAQANEVNSLLAGAGLDWTEFFDEGATFDNVLVTEIPPPALVAIEDGLGGANPDTGLADTFISPLGESCKFSSFALEATEPLTLNSATATVTGGGAGPTVTLADDGGGRHTVTLSSPVPTGQWVRLDLEVTGQDSGLTAVLTVWVAHQPLDITQDGRTNIQDATAFGAVFSGSRETRLIDINCNGMVNIQDATAFGTNWNAGWANTELPPKP